MTVLEPLTGSEPVIVLCENVNICWRLLLFQSMQVVLTILSSLGVANEANACSDGERRCGEVRKPHGGVNDDISGC